MPLPSSGQIAASQINTELGRSSTAQMSIVDARNGSYATINDASGFRPTTGPNYGYSYSDSYLRSRYKMASPYSCYCNGWRLEYGWKKVDRNGSEIPDVSQRIK